MSTIGSGRFHFTFTNIKDFTEALAISYLNETTKRCWVLVSKADKMIVVQPSVSTIGLNVLILKTETVEEEDLKKLKGLFTKEGVSTILVEYLRRPSQAQGFAMGFTGIEDFIKALKLFYLNKRKGRCRVVIPAVGPLLVQPAVSTLELNTLILEDFNSITASEKDRIDKVISSLEQFKCNYIENPFKTTNF